MHELPVTRSILAIVLRHAEANDVERVVAVELDRRLAARLAATAPSNVEIVPGDALRMDLCSLIPGGSRIVGKGYRLGLEQGIGQLG